MAEPSIRGGKSCKSRLSRAMICGTTMLQCAAGVSEFIIFQRYRSNAQYSSYDWAMQEESLPNQNGKRASAYIKTMTSY